MGRPTKPVEVLKLEGGYRKDRHGNRLPSGDGTLPEKPDSLRPEASQLWDSIIECRGKCLSAVDGPMLQSLCELWQLRCDVLPLLKENPSNANARLAFSDYTRGYLQIAAKFGLSPSDRAKLGIQPEKPSGVRRRNQG